MLLILSLGVSLAVAIHHGSAYAIPLLRYWSSHLYPHVLP